MPHIGSNEVDETYTRAQRCEGSEVGTVHGTATNMHVNVYQRQASPPGLNHEFPQVRDKRCKN